jgi:hypothetical protein
VHRLVQKITPAAFVFRGAIDRVKLPGHTIAAGRTVDIRLGGPSAFGRGPHRCPGRKVAAGEAEAALPVLARILRVAHVVREVRPASHPVGSGRRDQAARLDRLTAGVTRRPTPLRPDGRRRPARSHSTAPPP